MVLVVPFDSFLFRIASLCFLVATMVCQKYLGSHFPDLHTPLSVTLASILVNIIMHFAIFSEWLCVVWTMVFIYKTSRTAIRSSRYCIAQISTLNGHLNFSAGSLRRMRLIITPSLLLPHASPPPLGSSVPELIPEL
jgi:hypothetical protein